MRLKTQCGDWHKGWGLGGYDKTGTLYTTSDPTIFEWKGKSQGRHGQTWNHRAYVKVKWDGEKLMVLDYRGSYPIFSEIISAIQTLERLQVEAATQKEQKRKQARQKRIEDQLSQLSLGHMLNALTV